MQKIFGFIKKAIDEFDLIEAGDKIAIGVSGGKDSLILLEGLCRVKKYLRLDFSIIAITLDLQFSGAPSDYACVKNICYNYNIPYIVKLTDIGEVIFNIRKETHPCSLCARMRRGALHDIAKENGCNKIAFGHHLDDAVETFLMNLFNEGRIGCFAPKTYLSRKNITLIRPLVFVSESEVCRVAKKLGFQVVGNACPADGKTARQSTKEFVASREKVDSGFKKRIFGAMRRAGIDGWGKKSNFCYDKCFRN